MAANRRGAAHRLPRTYETEDLLARARGVLLARGFAGGARVIGDAAVMREALRALAARGGGPRVRPTGEMAVASPGEDELFGGPIVVTGIDYGTDGATTFVRLQANPDGTRTILDAHRVPAVESVDPRKEGA